MSKSTLTNALRTGLGSRLVPGVLFLLSLTISFPSLCKGLQWDDFLRQALLIDAGEGNALTDLPTTLRDLFAITTPDINAELMDRGVVPWWTYDNLLISHFRPLTALTHWIDYLLWPDSPVVMHLQNILLYGLACAFLTMFYRRLISPVWAAGLAAFLYTVDDAHIVPVVWIANRNALFALLFGILALIAHNSWRREHHRRAAFLAPLFLALSVCSAELGVSSGAYLVAYALFIDRSSWAHRVRSLLPYLIIGISWLVLYKSMGYGAYGSGLYIDPGREPIRFIGDILEQGPIFFVGQWIFPDPVVYYLLSDTASHYVWLGTVGFIALVVTILFPLLRQDRTARFWGVGMILSLLLICGIHVTTARPLLFAGIGAMGLIAQFIHVMSSHAKWLPQGRVWVFRARIHFALYLAVHAILSPVHFSLRMILPSPPLLTLEHTVAIETSGNRDLVIVNAPSSFNFYYLNPLRAFRGQPAARYTRVLSPGATSLELTRLDSQTVLVRPFGGFLVPPGSTIGEDTRHLPTIHPAYYHQHFDKTFRADGVAMSVGQEVTLSGMRVEVWSVTPDGRPLEASFRFNVGLEDESLDWWRWDWKTGSYKRFIPPRIGETASIVGPPPSMLTGLEVLEGGTEDFLDRTRSISVR